MSKTIRITENAYEKLAELAGEAGLSKQELIDQWFDTVNMVDHSPQAEI